MRISALLIVALVTAVNLAVWFAFNRPVPEVSWSGPIQGVSFSPYGPRQSPYTQRYPSAEEIDADMALLSGRVRKLRTYSSGNGFEVVPRLAAAYGFQVTAGAWLDGRMENNALEVENLVANAQLYGAVERVIVGNEAILREDLSVTQLAQYLQYVRNRVDVPVSTAEPWHIWLKYPELADYVDFIAIHVLPYWEQVPIDNAMNWVVARQRQVAAAFPDKPVVLAEVGWPSAGMRLGAAEPSLTNAARFIRKFLGTAWLYGLDYFIMEAIDQPWKRAEEGSVGPHWGLFDARRQAKFAFTGEIRPDRHGLLKATVAVLLAAGPALWFAVRRRDLRLPGRLFFTALMQAAASLAVWTALVPLSTYLSPGALFGWLLLFAAQMLLLAVILVNGFEMAELLWEGRRRRHHPPLWDARPRAWPKVSLHLAIHNEPPEMVRDTLNALARLDYPDFEVLVLDNNTRDPQVWRPVAEHCRSLGPRFRFFHLHNWPGYKAGALNFGLGVSAADAEIIGVVDSDYRVEPDWLRAVVPYFERGEVGFVQAPQDNRDWEGRPFQTLCNWEYKGFFELGMVQRNERNAIIQHGTMTLIRRAALERVGAWGEWCICEDAELGLRLLEAGYESVYINYVFGRGLVPESFSGYKNQRFRWVYGAVQILKGHWRALLGSSRLSLGQRFHFLTGWLPWFADALHLVFALAALFWTAGMLLMPRYFDFPLSAFLVPTLGLFVFKLVHSLSLYRARVVCTPAECLGAAVAGMSLTHSIAKAIFAGLFTHGRPFLRTPKSEGRPALVAALQMAREETAIGLLLLLAAAALMVRYGTADPAVWLWSLVLGTQAVPYLAACLMAASNVWPARSPRLASTTSAHPASG